MKILFVTPDLPSPTRPRSYNLIRGLAERGHQVSLFCIVTKTSDRKQLPVLHAACTEVRLIEISALQSLWNVLRAFAVGLPLQAVTNWNPVMARHIQEALGALDAKDQYDIVHIEGLRAARFGLIEPGHAPSPAPVVWDVVDSTGLFLNQVNLRSSRWLDRLQSRYEGARVALYESWLLEQFDRVLVTSPQDHDWLLSHQVPGKEPAAIAVLPNGVDLAYFHAQPLEAADPHTIILSGNMALQANIAMAEQLIEEIMPIVWGRLSQARVLIAGQNPAARVRKLAKDARITVTGTVEDIRPYLRRAAAAVAPLMFNLGIQNKVLEAMASNRPVVASPQAISGLQVKPGEEILVADDPIQFAEMLIDLLQNPEQQGRLGNAGLDYVARHHRWSHIVAQLETIYNGLANPESMEDETSQSAAAAS